MQSVPEVTNHSEAQATKVFLRSLKSDVDLCILDLGFHTEKQAFLQVTDVLKLFCSNVTLSAQHYNYNDLENFDKEKIDIKHLGMGVAETWRA